MPGSPLAGIAEKKASNAASPPADAPMPTMGKFGAAGRATLSTGEGLACPETRELAGGVAPGLVAWVFLFISGRPQHVRPALRPSARHDRPEERGAMKSATGSIASLTLLRRDWNGVIATRYRSP